MKAESMIHLQLEFSGVLLPVGTNEQGQKVVPLKPVSDIVGLDWPRQHKKVSETYLSKRLGTCVVPLFYAGQRREMVCIRLDRVAAFLNSINPTSFEGTATNPPPTFWKPSKRNGTI